MFGGFLHDVRELRKRARDHIDRVAVAPGYRGDVGVVLCLLDAALSTELLCVLRYKRHYEMTQGVQPRAVASAFLAYAREEQGHADEIATRIIQLGGEPHLDASGLQSPGASEPAEGASLVDMIQEDLLAERIVVDSYGDMIRYFGDSDRTTRQMLEGILATESEHADAMAHLLRTLDPGRSG